MVNICLHWIPSQDIHKRFKVSIRCLTNTKNMKNQKCSPRFSFLPRNIPKNKNKRGKKDGIIGLHSVTLQRQITVIQRSDTIILWQEGTERKKKRKKGKDPRRHSCWLKGLLNGTILINESIQFKTSLNER